MRLVMMAQEGPGAHRQRGMHLGGGQLGEVEAIGELYPAIGQQSLHQTAGEYRNAGPERFQQRPHIHGEPGLRATGDSRCLQRPARGFTHRHPPQRG